MGEWKWTAGDWYTDADADRGIQTTEDNRHHAVSRKMPVKVSNIDKPLVVQFTGLPLYVVAMHLTCHGSQA